MGAGTEFVKICVSALQGKTLDEISTAAATYVSAQKFRRRSTNERMRGYATLIDAVFRRVGLLSYLSCLVGLFFSFEPLDEQSLGPTAIFQIVPGGLALTLVLLVAVLALAIFGLWLSRRLVGDAQQAKSEQIYTLLAAQKHGPGLQRLLDKRNEQPAPASNPVADLLGGRLPRRASSKLSTTTVAPAAGGGDDPQGVGAPSHERVSRPVSRPWR